MQQPSCDIGLAVMGQNLVLNRNDHGYKWRSSTALSPRKIQTGWLEQLCELFHCQSSFPNQRSESSLGKLLVIGNG